LFSFWTTFKNFYFVFFLAIAFLESLMKKLNRLGTKKLIPKTNEHKYCPVIIQIWPNWFSSEALNLVGLFETLFPTRFCSIIFYQKPLSHEIES
jgi:hypothetical protein